MTYTPGGKGIAPRKSERPSWIGLKEKERCSDAVIFKTRTGVMIVAISEIEKFNRRKGNVK